MSVYYFLNNADSSRNKYSQNERKYQKGFSYDIPNLHYICVNFNFLL